MKNSLHYLTLILWLFCGTLLAKDHAGISSSLLRADRFTLIENAKPAKILIAGNELKGARIAAENLQADFGRVCGNKAELLSIQA